MILESPDSQPQFPDTLPDSPTRTVPAPSAPAPDATVPVLPPSSSMPEPVPVDAGPKASGASPEASSHESDIGADDSVSQVHVDPKEDRNLYYKLLGCNACLVDLDGFGKSQWHPQPSPITFWTSG